MTVSITHAWQRPSNPPRRSGQSPAWHGPLRAALRRHAHFLLAALLLWLPCFAQAADGLVVREAELAATDEGLRLNADVDVILGQRLEAALNRGVVLHFVADFDLIRPRSWWFDEAILSAQLNLRLSYNALTRQYLLVTGNDYQNFSTLAEARQGLGRLRDWSITERGQLKKKTAYKAALRMKLDVSQLPKPLQVSALGSKEWDPASEWYTWTYTHQGKEAAQ